MFGWSEQLDNLILLTIGCDDQSQTLHELVIYVIFYFAHIFVEFRLCYSRDKFD